MNKPLAYIIDLDGTLYDNSHRQHLIPADRSNTAGWVEFNCACADDVLREAIAYHNLPVIPEGSFPEVVLHMDQAQSVFLALKDKKVSERVNNPELGAMGATNIQVWTSKTGGELHFEASNGGCTLIIKSQGVTQ